MSKKTRRSRAEWESIIEEQAASGESVAGFCKSRDISTTAFYNRRSALNKSSSDFRPVKITPAPSSGKVRCVLLSGLQLEWDSRVPVDSILSFIRALS